MSLILRVTGNGSCRKLLAEPNGRLLAPQQAGNLLGKPLPTADGRMNLAPRALLDSEFEDERSHPGRLKMITRRHVKTHNSWTHNEESFVSGTRSTNYLYMHSEDAKAVGLRHGELADVGSKTGAVRIPIHFLDDLQPGTVAMPHGWGHQHAKGLSVASRTTGVNVNVLAESGPEAIEGISGMSRLTAIPVEVMPAAGPLEGSNWSGMPQPATDEKGRVRAV